MNDRLQPPAAPAEGGCAPGASAGERAASAEWFGVLVDEHPDGVFVKDLDGRYRVCNRALAALFGRAARDVIGRTDAELFGAALGSQRAALEARVLRDGSPEMTADWPVPDDEPDRRCETTVSAFTVAGHLVGVRGVVRDVGELHRTRARSDRERQRRLEAQALAGMGHWEVDLASDTLEVSEQVWHIFEADAAAPRVTSELFIERVHPDDQARVRDQTTLARRLRRGFTMAYRVLARDGSVRHVLDKCAPAGGPPGAATRLVGTVQDITDRVLAQSVLVEREERMRLALEASGQAVWDVHLPTGATIVSAQYARMLGFDPATFIDTPGRWLASLEPEDRAVAERLYDDYLAGRIPHYRFEYRTRAADGRLRWILSAGAVQERDAAGRPVRFMGTNTDITELKDAQEAVRAGEQRYRELFTLVPVPMIVYDRATLRLIAFNDAFLETYGYHRAEAAGLSLYELYPDHAHGFIAGTSPSLRGQAFFPGLEHRTRDGRSMRVDVSSYDVAFDGHAARVCVYADRTVQFLAERALRTINEDLERRVALRTAELDRSLEQLQRVNHGLETFTYSVSHDLKAPLRGIDGYSRLLEAEYAGRLDEDARGFIGRIRGATQHMGRLIDDLLSYSRLERREQTLAVLPVATVVDGVLAGSRDEIERVGAQIELDVQPDLRALGDSQGLVLALRNLVDNALKFSQDAAPPRVQVRAEAKGERVQISVRDNGVGFDMKFHDRIFAIFQRLHRAEEYPGTGVGLAIVHKAMERMGGRVWAESAPGAGSTFALELPLAPPEVVR